MNLTSSAFSNNEPIPEKYTCDGENTSPPLNINSVPENTKSLVLIMDDPDSPGGTFTHWVFCNIPPDTTIINENVPTEIPRLSNKSFQGMNSFGKIGYGGPCPQSGAHRYFFKLYALDEELIYVPELTVHDIENAMAGHILSEAQLVGIYKH